LVLFLGHYKDKVPVQSATLPEQSLEAAPNLGRLGAGGVRVPERQLAHQLGGYYYIGAPLEVTLVATEVHLRHGQGQFGGERFVLQGGELVAQPLVLHLQIIAPFAIRHLKYSSLNLT